MTDQPIVVIDATGKLTREPQASFDARVGVDTRKAGRRQRVIDLLARRRAELQALPPPADRTAAQRRQAADLRDLIDLASLLLAVSDGIDDEGGDT